MPEKPCSEQHQRYRYQDVKCQCNVNRKKHNAYSDKKQYVNQKTVAYLRNKTVEHFNIWENLVINIPTEFLS